jgi:hypothetical protein
MVGMANDTQATVAPTDGKTAIQKREERRAWTKAAHTVLIPGSVLKGMFARDIKAHDVFQESTSEHVQMTLERMAVRDPIEEMLVVQMMYTHQRMTELTAKASAQTNLKWAQMYHDAADRAANTYRRLMLALAEYRQPPRHRSVSYIQQANMAEQQVVQNVDRGRTGRRKKAANEKGFRRSGPRRRREKALPIDGGGGWRRSGRPQRG